MTRCSVTRTWVKITALLLLALWLPATSHAWLESSGLIHNGDHEDHDTNHEAADGICRIETGHTLVQPPTVTADLLPLLMAEVVALVTVQDAPIPIRFHRSTAPPELPKTWHFSERAALPGRAPDFAAWIARSAAFREEKRKRGPITG